MRRGLLDPVADSQAIFRAVLDAMAHPGRIVEVPRPPEVPQPLAPATAAVCLALVDFEAPLWLDDDARTDEVLDYLRFHCGAAIVATPEAASFAVVVDGAGAPALDVFDEGTDEEPQRSATVIVQVDGLDHIGAADRAHGDCRLTGPGIADEVWLSAGVLTRGFWASVQDNHGRFPRGVDLVLVAGTRIVALPRTTRVEIA